MKIIITLSLLLTTSISQTAPVVYFDFDGDGLQDTSYEALTGSSFTASAYVTNVDDLHGGLISWGAESFFDQNLVSASSYLIDSGWVLPGSENTINNITGTAGLYAVSFTGQTGTLKLFELNFDTLNTGSFTLSMGELYPGLTSFSGFGGLDGYAYDADILFANANANITISNVPVPPAIILMLSGLALLFGYRRKPE